MRNAVYLHPATLQYKRRLPSIKELEVHAAVVVGKEEISVSPRVGKCDVALSLWQLYERGCEEYDRKVCSGITRCHEGMVAMPQTGVEYAQVSRNARFQLMKLQRRAMKLSVPEELMKSAKMHQDRWSWEQWMNDEYEYR